MLLLKKMWRVARCEIDKPLFKITLSNILYSLSTFLVTITLPYLLRETFEESVYAIQMVLFLTAILQSALHMSLYYYCKIDKKQAIQIYMLFTGFLLLLLLLLSIWEDNPVIVALKLDSYARLEQFVFHLATFCSTIYSYNKALNLVTKSYERMLKVSLVAIVVRVLILMGIFSLGIQDLSLILIGVFIVPFVLEFVEYGIQLFVLVRDFDISKTLLGGFMRYSVQVTILVTLWLISDRLFLIRMKSVDTQFAAAVSFSFGFMGVLTLLYTGFSNFFLASLDRENTSELLRYITRLKQMIPWYGIMLIGLSVGFSLMIYWGYPQLDPIYSIVAFITILRTGFMSYLGLFSLLSRVLNLLNWEIILSTLRIIVVGVLCFYWTPSNLLIWYISILVILSIPEVVVTRMVLHHIYSFSSL